jgi:hypothetical protein
MTKTALFSVWILAFGAAALPRSTEIAIAAQDKFALKAPSGISFSEFRGYEDWPTVAASQTEDGIKVIAANTTMIAAYRAGIPDNGALFPEGAKIVKIEWSKKRSAEAPAPTWAPDTLRTVEFIEKDSARFPNSNGWGYAQFLYDAATHMYTEKDALPERAANGACHACHTIVKAKDSIFTAYPKR